MIYTNADCFTNKRNDLNILLQTLNFKPSAIIVTEVNSKVFSNNLTESEYSLSGYNLYSVNISEKNKRCIIVYIDSDLSSCRLELNYEFSEYLFVKIYATDQNVVTLGAFYRSPNSSVENDDKLLVLLEQIKYIIPGKVLLVGDFNFSSINWLNLTVGCSHNLNSSAYKFLECLNENFLLQHVLFPTRARGLQTPHILDLVISNGEFVEDILYMSPLGKSDHSVLHCVCKLTNELSTNVLKYDYNKGDYIGLCKHIRNNLDACYFKNGESVNASWGYFKSVIEEGMRLYIPRIKGGDWKKKSSWQFPIDQSLKTLIHRKHRCWTRFQ